MYNIISADGHNGHLFYFTTNSNTTYSLEFKTRGLVAGITRYEVDLDIIEGRSIYLDDKIRLTVVQIIQDFIDKNTDTIITYVCDTGDGKQLKRHKKFTRWYTGHKSNNLSLFSYEIDSESTEKTYYFSAIYDPIFTTDNELMDILDQYVEDKDNNR